MTKRRVGECTSGGARLPNGLTIEPEHLVISRPDDADTLSHMPSRDAALDHGSAHFQAY